MAGFQGSYSSTLDAKNRVHVPVRLRQGRDLSLSICFFTLGLEGQIIIFPKAEWRSVEAKIERYRQTADDPYPVVRALLANTYEVPLDAQNRLQVPAELLERSQVKKEIKILGLSRRIEIWDAQVFEQTVTAGSDSRREELRQLLR